MLTGQALQRQTGGWSVGPCLLLYRSLPFRNWICLFGCLPCRHRPDYMAKCFGKRVAVWLLCHLPQLINETLLLRTFNEGTQPWRVLRLVCALRRCNARYGINAGLFFSASRGHLMLFRWKNGSEWECACVYAWVDVCTHVGVCVCMAWLHLCECVWSK